MAESVLLIFLLPIILTTIMLHELAHGMVADFLGDPTPRNAGRLSLNPIKHLDFMGTLMLVVTKRLGWAKPVPINPMNFESPLRDMALVGAAGPLMNLFIAYTLGALLRHDVVHAGTFVSVIFEIAIQMNLGLAVFNLIPVPPLDGSRILTGILPKELAMHVLKFERYGFLLLLFVVFFAHDVLTVTIYPAIEFLYRVFVGGM